MDRILFYKCCIDALSKLMREHNLTLEGCTEISPEYARAIYSEMESRQAGIDDANYGSLRVNMKVAKKMYDSKYYELLINDLEKEKRENELRERELLINEEALKATERSAKAAEDSAKYAKDANLFADKSNAIAKKSNTIAIIAIIVSLISAIASVASVIIISSSTKDTEKDFSHDVNYQKTIIDNTKQDSLAGTINTDTINRELIRKK